SVRSRSSCPDTSRVTVWCCCRRTSGRWVSCERRRSLILHKQATQRKRRLLASTRLLRVIPTRPRRSLTSRKPNQLGGPGKLGPFLSWRSQANYSLLVVPQPRQQARTH